MPVLPDLLDLGDVYHLEDLCLPRPAHGYGVQWLGKDQLLDSRHQAFLPIRHADLQGIFADFDGAAQAAQHWYQQHWRQQHGSAPQEVASAPPLPPLAIVPVAYDPIAGRHILIYGVLQAELTPLEAMAYVHA